MAKKGQKYNYYSEETKSEIINKYLNEHVPSSALSKEYGISMKTVDTMIYRYRHPELKTGKKRGRPKNNDEVDYKERYEILKKYQAFLKAQRERK